MAEEANTEVLETEDAEVKDVEAELEADDISFEMEDEAEDTSSEDESDDSDDEEEVEDESDDNDGEAEAEDEPEAKEDEPKQEVSAEEQRKQHNREMAQKRLQEKEQRDAAIKAQQQDFVAEGADDMERAVKLLQVEAYNTAVERNTNKLTTAYEQAVKDFDILRDPSPEIQAELDQALDAFQAMYVTLDTYGNPTEVRGDLHQYLQTKANSIAALTGKGARAQEKSKAREKSKVLATPSRAPRTPKTDPVVDGFDEEAGRW